MATSTVDQTGTVAYGWLKSLYMANSCIQGDDFPAHIIWDKSARLKVRVKCPAAIQVKEVYNVDQGEGHVLENGSIEYTNFVVDGYIGFVFQTKPLQTTLVREQVVFDVESIDGHTRSSFTKEIDLFRPAVEIVRAPAELRIKYDKDKGSWNLSDRIRIRNVGAGTALVEIGLISEEDFQMGASSSLEEFQKAFLTDLGIKLDLLAKDHPRHAGVVQDVASLFKQRIYLLDEKIKSKIKSTFEELEAAGNEDPEFIEGFLSAVAISYIKNISVITELTSFLEYLNSIGEGRVIILNSIDSMKAKKSPAKLRMVVRLTDLADNNYPTLQLPPITVTYEGESGVPIHMLFDWKGLRAGTSKIG